MRELAMAGSALMMLLSAAIAAAQPPPDDARLLAAARVGLLVERVVGPVERHCGIYTIRDVDNFNVWAAVDRRQMREALRCVTQARKIGRATWVLWEVRGVDKTVFHGYAVSPTSDVHLVSFDSQDADRVVLRPCLRPYAQKDLTTRCLNRDAALDAGDVASLWSKLEKDAARTAGEPAARAVATSRQRATALPAPVPLATLAPVIVEAQTAASTAAGAPWPLCPLHGTHALAVRDGYWLCERAAVFVTPVGNLPKPRTPKSRP